VSAHTKLGTAQTELAESFNRRNGLVLDLQEIECRLDQTENDLIKEKKKLVKKDSVIFSQNKEILELRSCLKQLKISLVKKME
jgi:hypothetical protein